MKSIVDQDDVEGAIGERESLNVRDDRRDVEAVPSRTLARAPRGPEADVARDHACARPGEELGVHP